jgi:hypothetical protein
MVISFVGDISMTKLKAILEKDFPKLTKDQSLSRQKPVDFNSYQSI